jgi:hypothetical protein
LSLKNKDSIKAEDETTLALMSQEKPQKGAPVKPTMKPPAERPVEPADPADLPQLNQINAEGPFLDVNAFEYVLAVPKTFDNQKMFDVGGRQFLGLAPSNWCENVKFFVNGVLKNFQSLKIELDGTLKLDSRNRPVAPVPKVIIDG